jgi:hypothetical protein
MSGNEDANIHSVYNLAQGPNKSGQHEGRLAPESGPVEGQSEDSEAEEVEKP